MKDQYVTSITLEKLIEKLSSYLEENPEEGESMIYFDCLHINGKINKISENILELY